MPPILWFVKAKRAQSDSDFETWIAGGVVPTLNRMDNNGESRATVLIYPIDDGREVEKHQNGTGIGEANAPAYTLDTRQHASIAIAFDTYNQTISDKNKTLNSSATDVDHTGAIWEGTVVRRLTPTECERLQGFPDGWTADQADSNRYKQMGNAVAVPVVSWIIERLVSA